MTVWPRVGGDPPPLPPLPPAGHEIGLWTRDGVDNAGINFILDREKKTLQGLPKKKKNESCLSAKPGHELREILLKSRKFKFSEFNLKPSRRPGGRGWGQAAAVWFNLTSFKQFSVHPANVTRPGSVSQLAGSLPCRARASHGTLVRADTFYKGEWGLIDNSSL